MSSGGFPIVSGCSASPFFEISLKSIEHFQWLGMAVGVTLSHVGAVVSEKARLTAIGVEYFFVLAAGGDRISFGNMDYRDHE